MINANAKSLTSAKTMSLVRVAMLMAITVLLAATPLGYVYIPVIGMSLTIMVLPVVLGGVLLGPKTGIILGLTFGLTSLFKAPSEALGQLLLGFSPFVTVIVCVVPRVLVGAVAGAFHGFTRKKSSPFIYGAAGVLASATNTVFFLGLIYIFCKQLVEGAFGALVWSSTLVGGVAEAILAGVFCAAVLGTIKRFVK